MLAYNSEIPWIDLDSAGLQEPPMGNKTTNISFLLFVRKKVALFDTIDIFLIYIYLHMHFYVPDYSTHILQHGTVLIKKQTALPMLDLKYYKLCLLERLPLINSCCSSYIN